MSPLVGWVRAPILSYTQAVSTTTLQRLGENSFELTLPVLAFDCSWVLFFSSRLRLFGFGGLFREKFPDDQIGVLGVINVNRARCHFYAVYLSCPMPVPQPAALFRAARDLASVRPIELSEVPGPWIVASVIWLVQYEACDGELHRTFFAVRDHFFLLG